LDYYDNNSILLKVEKDYVEKFPDAPTTSEATRKMRSESAMGHEVTWGDKISKGVIFGIKSKDVQL
jgi:hypothetical protein